MPGARSAGRSGLPLPPVPAPARGAAHPSMPVPASAGRMPAGPLPGGPAMRQDPVHPEPMRPERNARMAAVLTEAPPEAWDDERSDPWATAGVADLGRPDVRVPAPRSDSGRAVGAMYGDWTKPSRSDELDDDSRPMDRPLMAVPGPGTTMIPERTIHRGRDEAFDDEYDEDLAEGYEDDLDGRLEARGYVDDGFTDERFPDRRFEGQPFDDERFDDERFDSAEMHTTGAVEPVSGPGTGPVGGRAARRAERTAADEARRKAAKARRGKPMDDGAEAPRRPRRVAMSLLAMALVALAVLGVYSFATPDTQETSASGIATSSAAPSTAPDTAALAPQPTTPTQSVEVAPTTPVRVPVTVLNQTDVNGLAAKISEQIVGAGWQSPGVGAYSGGDVSVTTVFFTEGDEQQRQAAVQLVDQFAGKINGPAPRFFEVPDVAAPGLVVVATGDWQP
jgi:hypothetical protein